MLPYVKTTRFKMTVAHTIFVIMRLLNIKEKRIIQRKGVKFEVDLNEGIDFSLFLFGSFQNHVTSNKRIHLPQDAVIFDVGANIGSFALLLARQYPHAVIYAFEPTHYAFDKLKRNLDLNEETIGKRVIPVQTFMSAGQTTADFSTAYSSWRIDRLDGNRHPVHLGIPKSATDKHLSIDTFVTQQNIQKLDLIKIDTDGHELEVLRGAVNSIHNFQPFIIFELTQYLLREQKQSFSEYEELLVSQGYQLLDAHSYHEVTTGNLSRIVPDNGGIDVLALPAKCSHVAKRRP